jgi:hypothetical protein
MPENKNPSKIFFEYFQLNLQNMAPEDQEDYIRRFLGNENADGSMINAILNRYKDTFAPFPKFDDAVQSVKEYIRPWAEERLNQGKDFLLYDNEKRFAISNLMNSIDTERTRVIKLAPKSNVVLAFDTFVAEMKDRLGGSKNIVTEEKFQQLKTSLEKMTEILKGVNASFEGPELIAKIGQAYTLLREISNNSNDPTPVSDTEEKAVAFYKDNFSSYDEMIEKIRKAPLKGREVAGKNISIDNETLINSAEKEKAKIMQGYAKEKIQESDLKPAMDKLVELIEIQFKINEAIGNLEEQIFDIEKNDGSRRMPLQKKMIDAGKKLVAEARAEKERLITLYHDGKIKDLAILKEQMGNIEKQVNLGVAAINTVEGTASMEDVNKLIDAYQNMPKNKNWTKSEQWAIALACVGMLVLVLAAVAATAFFTGGLGLVPALLIASHFVSTTIVPPLLASLPAVLHAGSAALSWLQGITHGASIVGLFNMCSGYFMQNVVAPFSSLCHNALATTKDFFIQAGTWMAQNPWPTAYGALFGSVGLGSLGYGAYTATKKEAEPQQKHGEEGPAEQSNKRKATPENNGKSEFPKKQPERRASDSEIYRRQLQDMKPPETSPEDPNEGKQSTHQRRNSI